MQKKSTIYENNWTFFWKQEFQEIGNILWKTAYILKSFSLLVLEDLGMEWSYTQ